jgi:O-antigen biosynthesis protein
MRMQDFVSKQDALASEEALFNIPFRKEYILAEIGRGKRVLDVGCLGGQISCLIQEQNNEVWGIELNPHAAKVAGQRGIRVKIANVEDGLPFEDGFFDAVNAGEIVEHLYDTKFFFEECFRVLKEGGILLFTTPNLNSLDNRVRVLAGGYLSMVGAYPEDHFGGHIRVFNLSKLNELCEQVGFRIEEVRGIPVFSPRGKLMQLPLVVWGRFFPKLSKFLIVKARKARNN